MTIVEGDLDKILAVAKNLHEEALNEGVAKVITTIETDDQRDRALSMKAR